MRATASGTPSVRAATRADLGALAAIERAAAGRFREAGLDGPWLESTVDAKELEKACAEGRLWVATDDGECAGFALAALLDDGSPFLAEVDVLPFRGRRGLGRALVDAVAAWARGGGHEALALTTFRDVPWNAPWYRSLGFRELADDELGDALRAVVAREAADGLPMEKRVAMRLALRAAATPPRSADGNEGENP